MEKDADAAVLLAGRVDRKEVGFARRRNFDQFELKAGVDATGRIVPKVPESVHGKVKLTSLASYVKVEQQLRLRNIGGWTPNAGGPQPGGPPMLSVAQLKELLRPYCETMVEKTGRGNETQEVTYLKVVEIDITDNHTLGDEVGDAEISAVLGVEEECDGGGGSDAPVVSHEPDLGRGQRSRRPTRR